MARRIDLAGQDAGDGLAAAGARIPGFQHRADLRQPRHQNRSAGFQHNGRFLVGLGDGVDQGVLVIGQAEVRHVEAFAGPLVGEDDNQVGALSRGRGGLDVLAIDIGYVGVSARLQSGHRRGGIIGQRAREAIGAFAVEALGANGVHLRRAAARQDAEVGVAADQDDLLRRLRHGQQALVVLQQDDGLFGVALGHLGVGGVVDRRRLVAVDRIVVGTVVEHGVEDAMGHVVQPCLGDVAVLDRFTQGTGIIGRGVERPARFLVEAVVRRLGGGVRRAPVGHDITLEAPVRLQDLVEEPVVLAGIVAVDAVVGAHHRTGVAGFQCELEGQQVGLARRLVVDLDIDRVAVGFLVVEGVMLHRRDDVVRLDALDLVAVDEPGQQGVFAGIFEVAAVARFAQQVDAAGQLDVETGQLGLVADHGAAGEGGLRVPGGGGGDAGGQGGTQARRRRTLGGHADPGVGFGLGRNAQAVDARHVAGGEVELVVGEPDEVLGAPGHPVGIGRKIPEDQGQLFIHGHRLDGGVGARVGAERRVGPGLVLGEGGGGEGQGGGERGGGGKAAGEA